MNQQYDKLGQLGLQFFGKVGASIAHELKNVLAILNENAGLLEDCCCAGERGAAIDPAKLQRTCHQFSKQILRADGIIKNLSHFSHIVDTFSREINLHELAVLLTNLAGRMAASRRVILSVEEPANPILLDGNPFLLQQLLWSLLEAIFPFVEPGAALVMALEDNPDSISLSIKGITCLTAEATTQISHKCQYLLESMGLRLSEDIGAQTLFLHLNKS